MIPNFEKLLRILGIDTKNWHLITVPTKFQNLILPDESFYFKEINGRYTVFFSSEYWETVERVRQFALKNYMSLTQKKFFYFYGVNQIGEERVAEYFRSKGYAIVRPEFLTLEEQLNVLLSCNEFASTAGSSSHNIIFMKDTCDIILIPRYFNSKGKSGGLNIHQMALDQVRDMNIVYIDSSLSVFSVGNRGPFCYIISKQLKEYFGDEWNGEYSDEDFITFLNYAIYSQQINNAQNGKPDPDFLEYYQPIYSEFMEQLSRRTDLLERFGATVKKN